MKYLVAIVCCVISFFLPKVSIAQSPDVLQHLLVDLIENEVYSGGKKYYYEVTKWDAAGVELSKEKVGLIIPKSLNADLSADEKERGLVRFIWQFNYDERTKSKLEPRSREEVDLPWGLADTTTMSLTKKRLSMHPLRDNQYYQVEASAHPGIEHTDEQNQFTSRIIVMKGFGKYNNKEFKSTYTLLPTVEKEFTDKKCKGCVQLKATTMAKGFSFGSVKAETSPEALKVGDNAADFLISPTRGFVKMYYQFYDGESLLLQLMD